MYGEVPRGITGCWGGAKPLGCGGAYALAADEEGRASFGDAADSGEAILVIPCGGPFGGGGGVGLEVGGYDGEYPG